MGRRISKDPEVRRQEIVAAACELFHEKSYDQVSVNDISKKVGLAQGTFYYHFGSKSELLDAVVEHEMRQNLGALDKIAADEGPDHLEKMQAIIGMDLFPGAARDRFVRLMGSEGNAVMCRKYQTKVAEILAPRLTRVVEDGVRDGVFEVRYPRETAGLLFGMRLDLERILAGTVDRSSACRLIRAAKDIYVKVVGVRPGSVRLIK